MRPIPRNVTLTDLNSSKGLARRYPRRVNLARQHSLDAYLHGYGCYELGPALYAQTVGDRLSDQGLLLTFTFNFAESASDTFRAEAIARFARELPSLADFILVEEVRRYAIDWPGEKSHRHAHALLKLRPGATIADIRRMWRSTAKYRLRRGVVARVAWDVPGWLGYSMKYTTSVQDAMTRMHTSPAWRRRCGLLTSPKGAPLSHAPERPQAGTERRSSSPARVSRACAAPDCRVDLDVLGKRAGAKTCSARCRKRAQRQTQAQGPTKS